MRGQTLSNSFSVVGILLVGLVNVEEKLDPSN